MRKAFKSINRVSAAEACKACGMLGEQYEQQFLRTNESFSIVLKISNATDTGPWTGATKRNEKTDQIKNDI